MKQQQTKEKHKAARTALGALTSAAKALQQIQKQKIQNNKNQTNTDTGIA